MAGVVERARRVPDSYRTFTEPAEHAHRLYQLPAKVLDRLMELGFPHQIAAGGPMFYANDLRNASEHLRLPSPQRNAIMLIASALAAGEQHPTMSRLIDLRARCPDPGHPRDCDFAPALSLQTNRQATGLVAVAAGHYRTTVSLPGGGAWHFTGRHRDLLEEIRDTQFARLPRELSGDPSCIHTVGLADCQSGSRFLLDRAAAMGLRARPAFGVLLTVPFSNTHAWIELYVGGEWRPADPLFLQALGTWGVVDPATWPPHRSPQGTHWRLGGEVEALIRHGTQAARTSLITRKG